MWKATEYHGVTGVVQFAIAAVDTAVWDIVGRALNKPLYKVLGAYRDRRAGGVTEWMEIAALADAFHVRVASHGGAGNLNLLCAMPNAIYLESGSLKGSGLKMVNGEVLAPDTPGLGTAVDDEYIEKHRVA